MIRCALLHDTGRRAGDLTIRGKIFAVLITTFAPKFAERLEINGNRALYVYHHHAEIGARKLQQIGLFKEAKIIAKHHAPPKPDDPLEQCDEEFFRMTRRKREGVVSYVERAATKSGGKITVTARLCQQPLTGEIL